MDVEVERLKDMHLSHKIKLKPNNIQRTYFQKACGCSRLAYNWGLEQWNTQYKAGEKPSAFGLKKQFNAVKKEKFPFVHEVTKTACERAFTDLDSAFKRFFKKKSKYLRFKKKGVSDSFYISSQYIKVDGKRIRIPKLGWVRMTEELRFEGRILSVTITKKSDMWFASIAVDIPDAPVCSDNQVHSAVGIDLGISKLATLSNGEVFENSKTTKKYEGRLRRLNKSLARKKKGSNNWKKAKLKLSRLHYKISCTRQDAIHKMTSEISKNYSDVCMEDLNSKGMIKNRRLSKAVSDASFGEIRRQLSYKAIRIHFVDRYFPSTKLCMNCGQLHNMSLNKRVFECGCGVGPIDRDLHAAQNILRQGLPEFSQ
jgi:putative transposase